MKIDFEFPSKYGVYRDAIHLPDDHGLSDEQIAAMKQQRFDNWIAIIEAPPVEVIEEPVQEEQPPAQE
jgi:MOSC domain-containing protein YiiM